MNLEPTGERMILEHYKSSAEDYVIYIMHIATYDFAERYTRGKRVLDYGCGSGYGSARIAANALEVRAVDVAADAIAHAQANFQRPNLAYSVIDPDAPLPFADGAFDTVLSFQVFEHVADTARYLAEVRRVLAPGGQLVLVTPDRSTRLLPLQRPWNRWHLKEYSRSGLLRELQPFFPRIEVLGMTGRDDVIAIETRRCRKIKWLTLPFTLPVLPDSWRVAALNFIHRHRQRGSAAGQALEFDFDAGDIRIAADASPSVNLVAIAG